MRFLVDECTGPSVARWLLAQGHEVFSVYEELRGAVDEDLLRKAEAEDWIIITNDKDFGEMIYRDRLPHRGVIFLRLADERSESKIDAIRRLLSSHADRVAGQFVVVTERQVRISRN